MSVASANDGDTRLINPVALVDCGLRCSPAQRLLVRVSGLFAVTAYHLRSDLDPHEPIMLGWIP
jgi:hypothetical protein